MVGLGFRGQGGWFRALGLGAKLVCLGLRV